jgi:hypothetical protein
MLPRIWRASNCEDFKCFGGFGRLSPVTAIETPGHHQWPVWRDNLINFASLLFQKSSVARLDITEGLSSGQQQLGRKHLADRVPVAGN